MTSTPNESELLPSERARLEEVGRFGGERIGPFAATLQAAFADDPYLSWICGDLDDEGKRQFWTAVLRSRSRGVELHALQTSESVAVWHPPKFPAGPGVDEPSGVDGGDAEAVSGQDDQLDVRTLLGDRVDEVFAVLGGMHAAHPAEPHWYLMACGTHPSRQNEGLGSRVLAPMLRRCDELGLPAYLESTNPANHSFYFRLGFEETGRYQAESAPEIVLMLRPPTR